MRNKYVKIEETIEYAWYICDILNDEKLVNVLTETDRKNLSRLLHKIEKNYATTGK